jgi:hypothetical protein
MQWPWFWELHGEEGAAWAQAYLSAVAIIAAGLTAVAVPAWSDRLAAKRARKGAMSSFVNTIEALADLSQNYQNNGEAYGEIVVKTLNVCQETLNGIDPVALRSDQLAAKVFRLRREIAFLLVAIPSDRSFERKVASFYSVAEYAVGLHAEILKLDPDIAADAPDGFAEFARNIGAMKRAAMQAAGIPVT